MSTSKVNAEAMVKLHGPNTIARLLLLKPSDASLVAVNRYKSALIFYKSENNYFYADYCNGRGWEKQRKQSLATLTENLAACSFVLVESCALDAVLNGFEVQLERKQILEIKSIIDAQFARVDARRLHEKNKHGYWQGHYDCLEILQHVVRKYI